jgi:hypothetical protein
MTLLVPALSAFQRRVDRICRVHRGIIILIGGLRRELRDELDQEIRQIPYLTKRPLLDLMNSRLEGIRQFDEDLGLIASHDEYLQVAEEAIENPSDLLFIPKHYIDTKLFKRFDKVYARWQQHAPHVRFGIDARGVLPFTGAEVEWRLLEAGLFEDLASLWNETHSAVTDGKGTTAAARIPGKRFRALQHSTIRAVFALLEGYINGIGVNVQWTFDLSAMRADDVEMLTERSADGSRTRYKRFRDKALQYPKIALGAQHPPIQETDADLALILQRERDWRDAVMHPTPLLEEERPLLREQVFFETSIDDLAALVDAAISFIRKVDTALGGNFGRVSIWIHDRQADGRFADEVFF